MLKRFTGSLLLISVTLLFLAPQSYSAELEDIRAKASLLPRALQSFDFSGEATISRASRAPEISRMRIRQAGENLRSDCESSHGISATQKPQVMKTIAAFNGTRYQNFFEHASTLTFSSMNRFNNPYWLPNPLVIPYLWLMDSDSGMMNWSDLKNQDLWTKKFEQARYEGETADNNTDLEVVSMPYLGQKTGIRSRVYFSKKLGYYPVKVIGFDSTGKQVLTIEVTKYKTFDSEDITIPFPLSIQTSESSPGLVTSEWKIDERSIAINQPIDEDVFTLSPSMAKTVDDYDKNIQDQKNMRPRASKQLPSPSPWRAVFLGGNIALVVVLMFIVIWRQRARRLS